MSIVLTLFFLVFVFVLVWLVLTFVIDLFRKL